MSSLAEKLFDGLKESVKQGLNNAVPEIGAELKRLGTQGSMELASALFNGSTFVPYGPGQYTPSHEHEMGGMEAGIETAMDGQEQSRGRGR